jgi:hypothetical protein
MNAIVHLWLPILATAVFIFIASSLIHMVFKWHNADYKKLANEDNVRAAIRAASPPPGQYVLPHCNDMKEMQGEAMQKKYVEGPIAFVTVRKNGPPTMGTALTLWFIYCVIIVAIAAMIAVQVYGTAANPRHAGYLIGVVSFLAFVGGSVQMGIWMGKPWSSVAKDALDGLIYATIGVLTFMWLWP